MNNFQLPAESIFFFLITVPMCSSSRSRKSEEAEFLQQAGAQTPDQMAGKNRNFPYSLLSKWQE